ncbi:hypothetical protein Tco_1145096 [Tanacetum coccineum]
MKISLNNFDDIKARIEAAQNSTKKLQEQEREQFTIEERAKNVGAEIVLVKIAPAEDKEVDLKYMTYEELSIPEQTAAKIHSVYQDLHFDLETAGDHRKVQLNELNELCDQAYENSLIYKEKTKRIHDSKIKNRVFNVGDQVLLFNSRLKMFSGKLKSCWSGPFTIAHVFPYGTVELSQNSGPNFKDCPGFLKHSCSQYIGLR